MDVSVVITKLLTSLGINKAFGIPGSSNPFFQAFYSEGVEPILPKHEIGAGWMAIGYQLYTDGIPVVLCSRGPGVAQVIPVLAAAKNDFVPLIVLTTCISRPNWRKHFQDYSGCGLSVSQFQLAKASAKFAVRIQRITGIRDVILEAWQMMLSHPQGPIYIEVDETIMNKSVDTYEAINKTNITRSKFNIFTKDCSVSIINKIAALRKPVFLIGAGLKEEQTRRLALYTANKLGACIVTTLKGKGHINNSCKFNYGVIGAYGSSNAKRIVDECDGIVALGTSLNEMTIGEEYLNEMLKRNTNIFWVNLFFDEIKHAKDNIIRCEYDLNHFIKYLYNKTKSIRYKRRWATFSGHGVSNSYNIFNILNNIKYSPKIYFVESVIQAVNDLVIDKPSQFHAIANSASLGCALPATIGAASTQDNCLFIAIMGDGGFQMSAMELMTAVNYKIKVICIILVNNALGPICRSFETKKLPKVACVFKNPDFSYLCNSFGIKGGHAHDLETFEKLLTMSVSAKGSCIIAVDYQM